MQAIPEAASASYRRDLGNGLVLRWSTAEDTEQLAQLMGQVFRRKEDSPPSPHMMDLVRRLMRGDHPTMGPGDYALVEDTHKKEGTPFVAGTCLWREHWQYEGIPFNVGRPEIVGTDPTYRNRGLVRATFELIHARSHAEGHLVQAITGIPYFYRQFGYEYAMELEGGRSTYLSLIPQLKENEQELYSLRDVTIEDVSFVAQCYARRRSQYMIASEIPNSFWQYEVEGWKRDIPPEKRARLQIIVDSNGAAQGFTLLAPRRWGPSFDIYLLEVATGVNIQALGPSLLRALAQKGQQAPINRPDIEALTGLRFFMESTHPLYEALGDALLPRVEFPYAWYVRVPNLPQFLQHIASVLEQRLLNSSVAGYTGELKMTFYRSGLRMVFEKGHLTTVEPYVAPLFGESEAGFPPLVFLQLLFGHRSLADLRYAFPDVWATDEAAVVLNTLFPKRMSAPLS